MEKVWRAYRNAAVALAALALSCSSAPGNPDGGSADGGRIDGGGTTVDADAICNDFASRICNKLNACSPYTLRGSFGDVATCIDRSKLSCVPAFGAPGSGVTKDNQDSCSNAYAAASCEDIENLFFPTVCRVFGTLANGAACGDSAQCQSGYCGISSGQCGTCKTKQNAGGSCGQNNDCERGLLCVGNLCKLAGGTGASCNASQPCKNTHVCVNGACARRDTAVGATCDPNNNNCDLWIGLWCNFDTNRCEQVGFTTNQSCGYDGTSFTLCDRSIDCVLQQGLLTGSCVAPATEGQACTPKPDAFACFPPAECVSGICKLPNPSSCQ